ncbi:Endoribonuclease protein [Vigna angularis]|uniref:Endoribonuclease protein n=1 Tax=Phaseolus angularis TaxID=3914 RepID=A0A8T0JYK4_PHAAN|nr:endoribonuclease YBEY, chloroplastic isoform X1 [Vigna angularis]KAG2389797.1 Endoribonuclease protein [Vigna angularis]
MLLRFSHFLCHRPPLHTMARAITCVTQPPHFSPAFKSAISSRVSLFLKSPRFGRSFHALTRCRTEGRHRLVAGVRSESKEYRKVRRRASKNKEKELQLRVEICLEEDLPDDPEILSIAELLRLNVPMAMKLAFDGLKGSGYKTRDTAISDVGGFDSVELSILLCNDEFIRKLNKEWRDEDHATDVLSMSSHIPELKIPILMLGDIVISVETAARQAEERGHTLLDEIRILMVHGLLHLLGFDHEISEEAEVEMEREEEILLKSLDWKGKGLIKSACDAETNSNLNFHHNSSDDELSKDRKKEGSLRFYKPKFRYIFCDMDGTLLNSKSQISSTTVNALREASSRGVKIVIATGKARPAVIDIFKTVDLAGKDGIVSEFSPGVFLQGLLVYGRQGQEIFRSNLDPNVCKEACLYSLESKVPLIAFCEGRCLTLFHDPLVDSLHTIYHEPKAEVMPSVEHLLASAEIQKMIFLDTAEKVAETLRPLWSDATKGRATVVQAVPDMLEIVPLGTSKGNGVKVLLDHLGVNAKEIMAIGDGENDIEMLDLASLGIALSNGSEKTKAVANVIGLSNDEDGVADAIYRYAF